MAKTPDSLASAKFQPQRLNLEHILNFFDKAESLRDVLWLISEKTNENVATIEARWVRWLKRGCSASYMLLEEDLQNLGFEIILRKARSSRNEKPFEPTKFNFEAILKYVGGRHPLSKIGERSRNETGSNRVSIRWRRWVRGQNCTYRILEQDLQALDLELIIQRANPAENQDVLPI
jgi:hypothetical protein